MQYARPKNGGTQYSRPKYGGMHYARGEGGVTLVHVQLYANVQYKLQFNFNVTLIALFSDPWCLPNSI